MGALLAILGTGTGLLWAWALDILDLGTELHCVSFAIMSGALFVTQGAGCMVLCAYSLMHVGAGQSVKVALSTYVVSELQELSNKSAKRFRSIFGEPVATPDKAECKRNLKSSIERYNKFFASFNPRHGTKGGTHNSDGFEAPESESDSEDDEKDSADEGVPEFAVHGGELDDDELGTLGEQLGDTGVWQGPSPPRCGCSSNHGCSLWPTSLCQGCIRYAS